jgi:hypothetical protein
MPCEHPRQDIRDHLPWDHLANYLIVIYHDEIGSPLQPTYCRVTRFSGTERGVVLLTDSRGSDDSEKVN